MIEEYINCSIDGALTKIISKLKPSKVLLVSGKSSLYDSGCFKKIQLILNAVEYQIFSDFLVNPQLSDVKKGLIKYREFEPDIILAIGGGSVIDMSKLINIFLSNAEYDIDEYLNDNRKIQNTPKPLIAVPTTAGTGSESTHFAVLYKENIKYSVASELILPKYIIIDPELTKNVPEYTAASAAIDALSQAIESYWSIRSSPESQEYSLKAIDMIVDVFDHNYDGFKNRSLQQLEKLAVAANYSGKAINITTTTAPHAISYPITTNYGLSHGHAVGLTLGMFFDINYLLAESKARDIRGTEYIKRMMEDLFEKLGCCSPKECQDKWYRLMNKLNLETSLKKMNIDEAGINNIIGNINVQRMNNHPVFLTALDLKDMFDKLATI